MLFRGTDWSLRSAKISNRCRPQMQLTDAVHKPKMQSPSDRCNHRCAYQGTDIVTPRKMKFQMCTGTDSVTTYNNYHNFTIKAQMQPQGQSKMLSHCLRYLSRCQQPKIQGQYRDAIMRRTDAVKRGIPNTAKRGTSPEPLQSRYCSRSGSNTIPDVATDLIIATII